MPASGALKQRTRKHKATRAKRTQKHYQEDSHSDVDMHDDNADRGRTDEVKQAKDEIEKKLEKLLFEDDDAFHEALKDHREQGWLGVVQGDEVDEIADQGAENEATDDDDLENIADADLFILDSGPAPLTANLTDRLQVPPEADHGEDEDGTAVPAVWQDSDDERLTVSLASHQRLRKLRVVESEDLINGKEYSRRLRLQFQRLHPVPEWADPDLIAKGRRRTSSQDDSHASDEDEMDTVDEDNELASRPLMKLLQCATDLTRLEENTRADGRRKLRQEVLDIQRLKDVGGIQPSSIDSLNFHPHYPLLLSSGPASTLFLHHISPSAPAPNPLLTSLHIRRTPIHTSAFAPPTGNKILASGRRRYFHLWDLDTGKVEKVSGSGNRKQEQRTMEKFKPSPCGRYIGLVGSSRKGGGLINILDSGTAQWIAQVRVDGRGGVADFAWWSDGEGMIVVSKTGEVSEYDCRLSRVIARWVDEGSVGTTVLSLGGRLGSGNPLGGDRWVAIGSSSGIVNIYDRKDWAAGMSNDKVEAGIPRTPKPVRVLDHLTTPISHLVFAPDGQMLVMASRWKRDAMRLVHLPSCTIYRNWPTSNTPLGRISSVTMSPNSDLLAVANEQGRIRLWEIRG